MINWFPGHMAKQFRLLKEKQKLFDLFIILLDSRLPLSSFNPEIFEIAKNKKILFIFNKIDLTNLTRLKQITNQYKEKGEVILTNLKSKDAFAKINSIINKYYLESKKRNDLKNKLTPPLKCVVVGMPNVGKSTLINLLKKSKVAKVGAMAGVTRSEQWINCKNYMLLDTPGLLMPKIEGDIGPKLALVGSISKDAISLNEFIVEIYKVVSKYFPEKIEEIKLKPSFSEEEIYEQIYEHAKNSNFLLKGNELDFNKSANNLINYFSNLTNVIYD
ncbi:ribosome biogenesis GTPase A [Metamycoplasma subdolum]|uniref:Ribosome biogenesis GTPase A n=1 Tax=Metamycoplasma subdolum TaxID=92407 RepID=A0A3M0A753_9BACT|nr:ribosome biogenesis GTPase YlqF [Metamycoplasma subdolum]RMA78638.1 ribosome biogenesis GTPase A [Metamycoplasma subdolum]WPB50760.1 ribosome biogenesis GTPase YlqF [Metamycoplasma subdolum]